MASRTGAQVGMQLQSDISGFLLWGHVSMAVCAVLYLAWWVIFFRPGAAPVTGALYFAGVACILLAAVAGIGGAIVIGMGTAKLPSPPAISGWWFVFGAVAVYVALAYVTSTFLHRPITTELVLFVSWTALELACLCALGATGSFGAARVTAFCVLVIVLFVVMLITYVLYYSLDALPSFIDGAIPLALVAVFSILMAVQFRL